MPTNSEHINATKEDGTLKKKYSDLPRYKAIYGYEGKFVDNFSTQINSMSKEIVKEIAILAGVIKNK